MKSPWRRRKKDAGKRADNSPYGHSKLTVTDRSGGRYDGKEHDIAPKCSYISCDATDHLSYGSTITGERRVGVDAPGWVRNSGRSFEEERPEQPPVRRVAPKILRSRRGAVEWPPAETASVASRSVSFSDERQRPTDAPRSQTMGEWPSESASIGSDESLSRDPSCGTVASGLSSVASHASQRSVNSEEATLMALMKPVVERQKSSSELSAKIFEAISSSESNDSMPPPNFRPRKEVRDAIKYHHKLGKALSELALDTEINSGKGVIASASTDSTVVSTLEDSSHLDGLEYATGDSRLGASNTGSDYKPDTRGKMPPALALPGVGSQQWVANFDQCDSGLDQVSSMDSGSSSLDYSTKSSRQVKLEQHLSFLEGHMVKKFSTSFVSPTNCEGENVASIGCDTSISLQLAGSFFPNVDDLRSPPSGDHLSEERREEAAAPFASVKATGLSPPSTPTASSDTDDWSDAFDGVQDGTASPEDVNDDDTVPQQELDAALGGGDALVEGVRRMGDETTTMLLEIKDKIRADIKDTIDNNMEQQRSMLKSTVSEMSERLEKVVQSKVDKENENPQGKMLTTKHSQFMSPRAPAQAVDSKAVVKELEKSLRSMEESIINKLSSQLNREASQQRQVLEEVIDEKVCRAIAGSSLEMKLAVQEMKKESERVSKVALREMRTPPRGRTPPRQKTPSRASGSARKGNSVGARRDSTGRKSSDSSWIRSNHSTTTKDVVEEDAGKQTLEESLAETMKAIDDFVDDCDDLADDFDKIAFRMQDGDIPSDPECDPDEYEYVGLAN